MKPFPLVWAFCREPGCRALMPPQQGLFCDDHEPIAKAQRWNDSIERLRQRIHEHREARLARGIK